MRLPTILEKISLREEKKADIESPNNMFSLTVTHSLRFKIAITIYATAIIIKTYCDFLIETLQYIVYSTDTLWNYSIYPLKYQLSLNILKFVKHIFKISTNRYHNLFQRIR